MVDFIERYNIKQKRILREGLSKWKRQKMEAEGFEPPAFRKHPKQCKANVIPLHQAPDVGY
jgi:3-mercaptopyruvate sulfurtransferase SseA